MAGRGTDPGTAVTCLVRPFAKADLEPSYGLWQRAWSAALPKEDIAALVPGWRRQFLEELLPARVVLAAEEDGALAGFAVIDPAASWLDQLVVDPSRHRRGIGRLLVETVSAIASERLSFRVVQANDGAIAFYERLGFVRVGPALAPGSGWPCWLYRAP